MVLNDVRKDIDRLLLLENKSQGDVARTMGVAKQQVSKMLAADSFVNSGLLRICDALGYDITLDFVKRGNNSAVLAVDRKEAARIIDCVELELERMRELLEKKERFTQK